MTKAAVLVRRAAPVGSALLVLVGCAAKQPTLMPTPTLYAAAPERLTVMTYSAGARVLSGAMHQLVLTSRHMSDAEMRERLPVGQVVFCAPDIDAAAFLEHVVEGLGRFPGRMTVYTNAEDGALGLSRKLYGNPRLGSLELDDLQLQARELLLRDDQISFVSVMNAKDANVGNGHGYFRLSPWVSSDVLLMLIRGLLRAERGLTRAPGDPIWRFPDDYEQKILGKLTERAPE